ncbi:MAG TPA: transcriptional repressor [Acidimicrobiales bacterium]|nr:transcriptional repressor [Acidimicrobiales bacterium]
MTGPIEGAALRTPRERLTRQKRALAGALDASYSFQSAQELFTQLRSRGENVGLTTIYNQLRALAEAGEVDVLRSDDGETLYRRCGSEHHHHHLVCRKCGVTVEVEDAEVERWATRIATDNGFGGTTHTIEIIGTCANCMSDGGPDWSGDPARE